MRGNGGFGVGVFGGDAGVLRGDGGLLGGFWGSPHTFQQPDLIQRRLRVLRCALHHLQRHEALPPFFWGGEKGGHTMKGRGLPVTPPTPLPPPLPTHRVSQHSHTVAKCPQPSLRTTR